MRTVNEVSKLAGVSVRTLHHYDKIGLLHPTAITQSGYRLYDDTALEQLQQILLFRELEFPLKEIKRILSSSSFQRSKAIEQQIELLTLKKEHIERLISFAREIKETGVNRMDFTAFDTSKIEEYKKQAKEQWGTSTAYQEYERKTKDLSKAEEEALGVEFMSIFSEFGKLAHLKASNDEVQKQVKKLQDYITAYYYTCTNEILSSLGMMYGAGGEFTENIDKVGGPGTAKFVSEAIIIYCSK